MSRPLKVHAARFLYRHKPGFYRVNYADEEVTCLRCMWWMRRYIPLTKLKEHQHYSIMTHYRVLGNR